MSETTEAFSRVKIDALLTDADWNPTEDVSVPFQYTLDDSTLADNVLYDRADRPMAALEAEGAGAEPSDPGPGPPLRRTVERAMTLAANIRSLCLAGPRGADTKPLLPCSADSPVQYNTLTRITCLSLRQWQRNSRDTQCRH